MLENRCLGCFKADYDFGTGICPVCHAEKGFSNQDHQLVAGSVIGGRYVIGRALGQGGFGITYAGWDAVENCKVAIKEYFPSGCAARKKDNYTLAPYSDDENRNFYESGLSRFLSEAKCLKNMGNIPNVVRVKDYFKENATAYIVMDYVEGITLKQYLMNLNGKTTLADIMEKLHPVVTALSTVHSRNIIHRDISPDNIVLSPMGAVLIDFGSARAFSVGSNTAKTINVKLGYAPPEQYDSHGSQGPWTDVFAFASTIYRAVTGILPASAIDRTDSPNALRSVRELNPDISDREEAVILKGMNLSVADRYQNIFTFYNDLMFAQANHDAKADVSELVKKVDGPASSGSHLPMNKPNLAAWIAAGYTLLMIIIWFSLNKLYWEILIQQLITTGILVFAAFDFFKSKKQKRPLKSKLIKKLLIGSVILNAVSALVLVVALDVFSKLPLLLWELHVPLEIGILVHLNNLSKKNK